MLQNFLWFRIPCFFLEGDRSDGQLLITNIALSQIELPLIDNLINRPPHRAWFLKYNFVRNHVYPDSKWILDNPKAKFQKIYTWKKQSKPHIWGMNIPGVPKIVPNLGTVLFAMTKILVRPDSTDMYKLLGTLQCLLSCLNKSMATRYFKKSSFQETFILFNFIASNPIRYFIIKRMKCVTSSKIYFCH